MENIQGFLLNDPTKKNKFFTQILRQSGRHWTCIRKVNDKFVYLDSLEKKPTAFEDNVAVEGFLEVFKDNEGTILVA